MLEEVNALGFKVAACSINTLGAGVKAEFTGTFEVYLAVSSNILW